MHLAGQQDRKRALPKIEVSIVAATNISNTRILADCAVREDKRPHCRGKQHHQMCMCYLAEYQGQRDGRPAAGQKENVKAERVMQRWHSYTEEGLEGQSGSQGWEGLKIVLQADVQL